MQAKFSLFASLFLILIIALFCRLTLVKYQDDVNLAEQQWQQSIAKKTQKIAEPVLHMLQGELDFVEELAGTLASTPNLEKTQIEALLLAKAQQRNHQISDRALGLLHFDGKRLGRVWTFGEARFLMSDKNKRNALRYQLNQALRVPQSLLVSMPEKNNPNYGLISYAFDRNGTNNILVSRLDLGLIQIGLTHFHLEDPINLEFELLNADNTLAIKLVTQQTSQVNTTKTQYKANTPQGFAWQVTGHVPLNYLGGVNTQLAKQNLYLNLCLLALVSLFLILWLWMLTHAQKECNVSHHVIREKNNELQCQQKALKDTLPQATSCSLIPALSEHISATLSKSLTAISSLEERSIILQDKVDNGKMSRQQASNFVESTTQLSRAAANNILTASAQVYNFKQLLDYQHHNPVENASLDILISEIVSSLKPQLKQFNKLKQQIICTVPEDLYVHCAVGSLSQLLQQVLLNAMVHGIKEKESGVIMIEAFKGKKPEQIVVRIEDNGHGIDKEILTLFNNSQAENPAGIALCHELAQVLKAEIKFASKVKRYTRCTLTLSNPVAKTATKQQTQASTTKGKAKPIEKSTAAVTQTAAAPKKNDKTSVKTKADEEKK